MNLFLIIVYFAGGLLFFWLISRRYTSVAGDLNHPVSPSWPDAFLGHYLTLFGLVITLLLAIIFPIILLLYFEKSIQAHRVILILYLLLILLGYTYFLSALPASDPTRCGNQRDNQP